MAFAIYTLCRLRILSLMLDLSTKATHLFWIAVLAMMSKSLAFEASQWSWFFTESLTVWILLLYMSFNSLSIVRREGSLYSAFCNAVHNTCWRPSSSTIDIGLPLLAIQVASATLISRCKATLTGRSDERQKWLKVPCFELDEVDDAGVDCLSRSFWYFSGCLVCRWYVSEVLEPW